mgnify:CR=1 FL=1
MRNKKILGALLAVTTLATFGLAGCGNSGSNGAASKEDDKTITVAASPTPHAEILEVAKEILAAKGSPIRTVTVQEYSGAEDGHDDGLFVTRPL